MATQLCEADECGHNNLYNFHIARVASRISQSSWFNLSANKGGILEGATSSTVQKSSLTIKMCRLDIGINKSVCDQTLFLL